jgi:DNA helicase-2/ATP-dependent DNA helicase PcrA
LPDFIERLSLLQATDDENAAAKSEATHGAAAGNISAPQNTKQNTVHLSTVHMAKGLEFDTVFVAGAAEGLLPHIRSIESDAALEEERRLMYVAMTRARKNLYISFYGLPSRFIAEIPEEYVTLAGDSDFDGGGGGAKRSGNQTGFGRSTYDPYGKDDSFDDNENYVTF